MRRSELSGPLFAAARGLLASARAPLVIGSEAQLGAGVATCVEGIATCAALTARHDGVLWVLPEEACDAQELRADLTRLRPLLQPSALIALAAVAQPSLRGRLRGFVRREAPKAWSLELLCGALLTCGLAAPRVHPVAGWWLVAAALPALRDPLDAFFEQPPPPARR